MLRWLTAVVVVASAISVCGYGCGPSNYEYNSTSLRALSIPYPLPPNTVCVYHIRVPENASFVTTFNPQLRLGDDSLSFYDGPSESSPFLGRFYGGSQNGGFTPTDVLASSRDVTVVLRSGAQNLPISVPNITAFVGWSSTAFVFCSGVQHIVIDVNTNTQAAISEPPEHLLNPLHNMSYRPGSNCSWLITVPAGYFIRISTFIQFMGVGDTLSFFDGPSSDSPLLLLTGRLPDAQDDVPFIQSSDTNLFVNLLARPTSSFGNSAARFKLLFTATLQHTVCPGVQAIVLSDSGASQVLSNPSPPQAPDASYTVPANTSCSWLVTASTGKLVYIREVHVCVDYGVFQVFDGPNASFPLLTVYEGGAFNATGPQVFVLYRSHPIVPSNGAFTLTLSAVPALDYYCTSGPTLGILGGQAFSSIRPYLSSFGMPRNRHCSFNVDSGGGGNILIIQLLNIDLAEGDSLTIVDQSYILRANFTGPLSHGFFSIPTISGHFKVDYVRGAQGQASGFQAQSIESTVVLCNNGQTINLDPVSTPGFGTFSITLVEGRTCGIFIPSTGPSALQIDFSLSIRSVDMMRVYQGSDRNGVLLAMYTGLDNNVIIYDTLTSPTTSRNLYLELSTSAAIIPNQFYGTLDLTYQGVAAPPVLAGHFLPINTAVRDTYTLLPGGTRNVSYHSPVYGFAVDPLRTTALAINFSSILQSSDQSFTIYDGNNIVVQCPGALYCSELAFTGVYLFSGNFSYAIETGYISSLHAPIIVEIASVPLSFTESGAEVQFRRPAYSTEYAYLGLMNGPLDISLYYIDWSEYPDDIFGAGLRYDPREAITILISSAVQVGVLDPETVTMGYALQLRHLDLQAGARVTIYQGETTATPVVRAWSGDIPYENDLSDIVSLPGQSLLIVFNGPTDPNAPLGYGFNFKLTASTACISAPVILPVTPFGADSTRWTVPPSVPNAQASKSLVLPNAICTTTFVAPPGYRVAITKVESCLRVGDFVFVHDGDSVVAPGLTTCDDSSAGSTNMRPQIQSSGTTLTVRFVGKSLVSSYPLPAPLIALSIDVIPEIKPCSGEQTFYLPMGGGVTFGWARYANHDLAYTFPPLLPLNFPANLNCTWVVRYPLGTTTIVYLPAYETTSGGGLTVRDASGRPVHSSTSLQDGSPLKYALTGCGGLATIHFQSGSLPLAPSQLGTFNIQVQVTVTGVSSELFQFDDTCRSDMNISSGYCQSDFSYPLKDDFYTNCSVIYGDQLSFNQYTPLNMSFPKTVLVMGCIEFDDEEVLLGLRAHFPVLYSVDGLHMFNVGYLSMPSLTFADKFFAQDPIYAPSALGDHPSLLMSTVGGYNLTRLKAAGNLFMCAAVITEVFLPELEIACQLSIRSSTMSAAYLPKLRLTSGTVSAPLRVLDLSQLEYTLNLDMSLLLLDDLILPTLFTATSISISGNPPLKSIQLPTLQTITRLKIFSNYFVTHIDLSQLIVTLPAGADPIEIQNARIVSLDLPQLVSGNLYLNDLPALKAVNVPRLAFAEDLRIALLPLTCFAAPSLRSISGVFDLDTNLYLEELHMCRLNSVNMVTVTQCPCLSCSDFIGLVTDISSVPNLPVPPPPDNHFVAPQCNELTIGKFACSSNITLFVNESCFAVACIQEQIDAAYSGQNYQVQVHAGTYTGCASPLNTNNKILTIVGAGIGATVIDCQGSGHALEILLGEGPGTEFRDTSFINGIGSNGGNALVLDSSPTFTGCAFNGGTASQAGGGLYIQGSISAPVLNECEFVGNTAATNGGGLAINGGGAVVIVNCIFQSNEADQGGSVAILGVTSSTPPVIMQSFIYASTATRGGGIFSDSALRLDHVLVKDCVAQQFGGGLAAISTQDSGTNYEIVDSTFESNSATSGGGIFGFSANLDIDRTLIHRNTAGRNGGGGISVTCSQNYRILGGIVVPCDVYVHIRDTAVFNNTAINSDGGGMLVRDVQSSLHRTTTDSSSLIISSYVFILVDSTVMMNRARSGGGAYVTVSVLNSTASEWSANRADQNGGAFYCEPFTGLCDSQQSQFVSNTAGISGGALYFCTTACPDMTDHGMNHSLPRLMALGNTYTDNMVALRGYGPDTATDASQLKWINAPAEEIISGAALNPGGLSVTVADGFDQVVTSSTTILTLSLRVETALGSVVGSGDVVLGGTQTVLAAIGRATFPGVTFAVTRTALLGTNYTLSCRVSELSTVALRTPIKVLPCQPGGGRSDPTGLITCDPCAAGSAADSDYVCIPCPKGSFAAVAGSAACSPCDVNTHAPVTGSITCLACPAGFSAPNVGSVDCTQDQLGGLVGSAVGGTIAGVVIGILMLIACCVYGVFRLAKRRTMQKYYLDNDATVRTGTLETPLQKEVKRILLANGTTRIGGGLYSNVYKAKYDDLWIALKVIKGEMATDATAQQEFRREAIALSLTEERDHPGIVRLIFYLTFNPMCIGIEFCRGGSLKRALANKAFPDLAQKVQLAAEAASAMAVVHSCGIVHLDLKTDNMLLSPENHLIVADFGVARTLGMGNGETRLPAEYIGGMDSYNGILSSSPLMSGSPTSSGSAGTTVRRTTEAFDTAFTPQYVDPIRILFDKNDDDVYLKTADVFSYAMVMWAIMTQEEPYAGENPDNLVANLRANALIRPRALPEETPAFYDTLMRRCWHENPSSRPSFTEVFQQLKDDLLATYGVLLEPGYANPNLA